jgi:hypothetical protein
LGAAVVYERRRQRSPFKSGSSRSPSKKGWYNGLQTTRRIYNLADSAATSKRGFLNPAHALYPTFNLQSGLLQHTPKADDAITACSLTSLKPAMIKVVDTVQLQQHISVPQYMPPWFGTSVSQIQAHGATAANNCATSGHSTICNKYVTMSMLQEGNIARFQSR